MMSDFVKSLPGELVTQVMAILGPRGEAWLRELPVTISALEQLWEVRALKPFPGIEFNYVAAAEQGDGTPVVLKIAPPYDSGEAFSETAFLRHHNGRGCVRLLSEDRGMRAMLLERALPGSNFADHFKDREPECIAPSIEVLRALIGPPPEDQPDVIELDAWFDGLRRYPTTDFPKRYAEKALALYDELSDAAERLYLHGDFHPANIVTATRDPFLAIDPKGLIGGIGYDIAVFLNNYHWWQETRDDVRKRLDAAIEIFAAAFQIKELTLRQWAFVQMVLSAWWTYDETPELYENGVAKADVWGIL